ncbi:MAG: iron ABC transporter permease [Fibrobacter sp.]|nr:iron ABC transporter permease [Fibrobacter sp.]
MVRRIICFGVLGVLAVLLMAGTLCIGPVDLDSDMFATVLWKLRVPRLVAAVLAGAALSVSGLSLQTLFRNPLAGPFVLGISNGASFGVALALLAGFSFGNFGVLTAASLGALAVTAVILWIASKFERNSVLLVAGLLIGYFIDALVSLLIAGSDAESLRMYISWGMGSFGRLTPSGIGIFAVAVGVGLLLIVSCLRYLNGARLGDDFARGLGLSVAVQKKCVLLGASILAAAVTAFCGPVAFIGIAVPHLTYLLFRTTNHRVLIPGVMLCGADLTLLAGLFPTIPLNATLSIVGVPVILWVLLRSGREGRL